MRAELKLQKLLEETFENHERYSHSSDRRSLDRALESYFQARDVAQSLDLPPVMPILLIGIALAEQFADAHSDRRGPDGQTALNLIELATVEASELGQMEMVHHAGMLKAQVLADWVEGDRKENFEQSVAILSALVDRYRKAGPAFAVELAEALTELGYTYSEARIGHEADNTEFAIAYLEEAAAILPDDAPDRLRGNIFLYLGDGYKSRMRGDYLANLKLAAQYYESAEPVFLSAGLESRAARASASFHALMPRIAGLSSNALNARRKRGDR